MSYKEEYKELQKSGLFRKAVKYWRERGFNKPMSFAVARSQLIKPKEKKVEKVTFAEDQAALL